MLQLVREPTLKPMHHMNPPMRKPLSTRKQTRREKHRHTCLFLLKGIKQTTISLSYAIPALAPKSLHLGVSCYTFRFRVKTKYISLINQVKHILLTTFTPKHRTKIKLDNNMFYEEYRPFTKRYHINSVRWK